MPKKSSNGPVTKTVEALKHDVDKRKNIPTAEYQSVLKPGDEKPIEIRYPRNRDLDPQLMWRGKDAQDWSDLVVHAPPLYIQEKVHPKVLIDDLLTQSKAARAQTEGFQPDLFSDFNGIPKGADKTDFYHHDQNWSNRMILGDSLQVMASLAEREGLRSCATSPESGATGGALTVPRRPWPCPLSRLGCKVCKATPRRRQSVGSGASTPSGPPMSPIRRNC
jgi:adenine-specific DNA-methyltransferase